MPCMQKRMEGPSDGQRRKVPGRGVLVRLKWRQENLDDDVFHDNLLCLLDVLPVTGPAFIAGWSSGSLPGSYPGGRRFKSGSCITSRPLYKSYRRGPCDVDERY
jgi:hypothetical protein